MIKKILTLLLVVPVLANAQPSKFLVKGKLNPSVDHVTLFLGYKVDGIRIVDSAIAMGGIFSFSGAIDKGEFLFASIVLDRDHLGFQTLSKQRGGMDMIKPLLVAGTVTIQGTDSLNKARIEDEFSINNAYKELATTHDYIGFSKKYSNSLLSIEALRLEAGAFPKQDIILPVFKTLSTSVQNSKMGKELVKYLENFAGLVPGVVAPDFIQKDTAGNAIKLSAFRGKYLLLDFWASWCGPCRVSNPSLVKLYQQFKDKNFTILGISLDRDKKEWTDAIKQDGLSWIQVSDLKHYSNQAAVLYAINAIPQNILIDTSGKIIAKNLSIEKLESTLKQYLQ